jgi:Uma2 family endonuclease
MSMPALHARTWTLEEVERLIAERPGYTPRYELVDGELLVTPGPSGGHQRIAFVLSTILWDYAKRIGFGEIRQGPGDVRLTDDSYLETDVFVIPTIDGRFPTAANRVNEVVLAVEVLSPSSARHDRVTKRHFFQRNRVPGIGSSIPRRRYSRSGIPTMSTRKSSRRNSSGSRSIQIRSNSTSRAFLQASQTVHALAASSTTSECRQ